MQDYIRGIFLPFKPSLSHGKIPTFRWRAIVTTNYDCLIEDAYSGNPDVVQKIVPLFKNTDRWDDVMRDPTCVPLLKLHGCITRTRDEQCPLILSTEQYLAYDIGRSRLFRLFQELAAERPYLYIGYSNTDPDIRALIQQLDAKKLADLAHSLLVPV